LLFCLELEPSSAGGTKMSTWWKCNYHIPPGQVISDIILDVPLRMPATTGQNVARESPVSLLPESATHSLTFFTRYKYSHSAALGPDSGCAFSVGMGCHIPHFLQKYFSGPSPGELKHLKKRCPSGRSPSAMMVAGGDSSRNSAFS